MPIDTATSRHFTLPGSDPWKCPACGVEHVTDLHQGCPACGAGKPGYKVATEASTPQPAPEAEFRLTPLQEAFRGWLQEHPRATVAEAFMAGYDLGRQISGSTWIDTQAPKQADPETATIISALEYFLANVLQFAPEEVTTGEWLTPQQTQQLLARLRGGTA